MQNYVSAFIFGALGLLLSGGALLNIVSTLLFLRRAKKTDGTIVGFRTKRVTTGRRMKDRTVYLPVIEYAPAEIGGQTARITSTVGSNPPAYNVGEIVTVYFAPRNPRGGRLHSFWESWFFPLLILFVGGLICLFAYAVWQN